MKLIALVALMAIGMLTNAMVSTADVTVSRGSPPNFAHELNVDGSSIKTTNATVNAYVADTVPTAADENATMIATARCGSLQSKMVSVNDAITQTAATANTVDDANSMANDLASDGGAANAAEVDIGSHDMTMTTHAFATKAGHYNSQFTLIHATTA